MRLGVILAAVLIVAPADAAPNARAAAAAQFELGRDATERGDDREALRRFEEAFVLWPAPPMLLNVAEAHLRLHETDRAIESLRHLIRMAGGDPAHAELVQHAQLRLVELRRGAHPLDEDEAPGPDGIRALGGSTAAPRRSPFVAPIDDSLRPPVVEPLEDARPPAPRLDLEPAPHVDLAPASAPPPKQKRSLAPWETGLVAVGVVAGLVLTFAPILYYTVPQTHSSTPIAFGGTGATLPR